MSIEELTHELQEVSTYATKFKVNHDLVAGLSGVSRIYVNKIKDGSRILADKDKNKELLQTIINNYRKELRKKQRELEIINSK